MQLERELAASRAQTQEAHGQIVAAQEEAVEAKRALAQT